MSDFWDVIYDALLLAGADTLEAAERAEEMRNRIWEMIVGAE